MLADACTVPWAIEMIQRKSALETDSRIKLVSVVRQSISTYTQWHARTA